MVKLSDKSKILITICIIGILSLSIMFSLRNNKIHPTTRTMTMFDTVVTLKIYDKVSDEVVDGFFELCKEYELIFDRTNPESELYKLNQTMAIQKSLEIPISQDISQLLQSSMYYSSISNGKFDITIAPITALWDFSESTTPPDKNSITNLLPLVNYKNIELHPNTITNKTIGIEIEFGGIAKGYISEKLKAYLDDNDVKNAIINLGGNIVCIGSKPHNEPFTVGIAKPFSSHSDSLAEVKVYDKCISTCGIYERCYNYDGKFYHHVLDTSTGFPIENTLQSVTIISDDSIMCDALSTICFTLDLEEGLKLLEDFPQVQAIFIDQNNELHTTTNLILPESK